MWHCMVNVLEGYSQRVPPQATGALQHLLCRCMACILSSFFLCQIGEIAIGGNLLEVMTREVRANSSLSG